MKLLFTLLLILITKIILSFPIVNDHLVMHDFTTPVITFVKLNTGEVSYTTTLKEKTLNVKASEDNKWVYVMTKHYAYKINGLNGEIQIEFLYQPVLKQSSDDYTDPNMRLSPIGLNSDGIGFYFNTSDNPSKVYKFDTDNRTKTTFCEVDQNMGSGKFLGTDKLYFYEMNNPYSEDRKIAFEDIGIDMNQIGKDDQMDNSKNSYSFHATALDQFEISESFEISMNLEGNEYNLTSSDINSLSISSIEGDTLSILILTSKESLKNHKLFYQYNIRKKQQIGIKGFEIESKLAPPYYKFNKTTNEYVAVVNCQEKEPMPIPQMETYIPKKNNKKARAEAENINQERLQQYERDLQAYSEYKSDFSHCTTIIKKRESGETILEIYGIVDVQLIQDNYLFYYDGLEYVMFDITKNEVIWTLMN